MASVTQINSYQFGRIIINENPVTSDVIILPSGTITPDWRRKHGHILEPDDINPILEINPELIVIGTGFSGQMKIDPRLIDYLNGQDIEYRVYPTGKAVKIFNQNRLKYTAIAACFHITC